MKKLAIFEYKNENLNQQLSDHQNRIKSFSFKSSPTVEKEKASKDNTLHNKSKKMFQDHLSIQKHIRGDESLAKLTQGYSISQKSEYCLPLYSKMEESSRIGENNNDEFKNKEKQDGFTSTSKEYQLSYLSNQGKPLIPAKAKNVTLDSSKENISQSARSTFREDNDREYQQFQKQSGVLMNEKLNSCFKYGNPLQREEQLLRQGYNSVGAVVPTLKTSQISQILNQQDTFTNLLKPSKNECNNFSDQQAIKNSVSSILMNTKTTSSIAQQQQQSGLQRMIQNSQRIKNEDKQNNSSLEYGMSLENRETVFSIKSEDTSKTPSSCVTPSNKDIKLQLPYFQQKSNNQAKEQEDVEQAQSTRTKNSLNQSKDQLILQIKKNEEFNMSFSEASCDKLLKLNDCIKQDQVNTLDNSQISEISTKEPHLLQGKDESLLQNVNIFQQQTKQQKQKAPNEYQEFIKEYLPLNSQLNLSKNQSFKNDFLFQNNCQEYSMELSSRSNRCSYFDNGNPSASPLSISVSIPSQISKRERSPNQQQEQYHPASILKDKQLVDNSSFNFISEKSNIFNKVSGTYKYKDTFKKPLDKSFSLIPPSQNVRPLTPISKQNQTSPKNSVYVQSISQEKSQKTLNSTQSKKHQESISFNKQEARKVSPFSIKREEYQIMQLKRDSSPLVKAQNPKLMKSIAENEDRESSSNQRLKVSRQKKFQYEMKETIITPSPNSTFSFTPSYFIPLPTEQTDNLLGLIKQSLK